MVKPTSSSSSSSLSVVQQRNADEIKYKGVRKRKWGKWVSEIRLPNSRERIWLGSYDTPEKAARAFDVALFCLRGPNAKFNFPDNPPIVDDGQSLTPQEIQEVASQIANNEEPQLQVPARGTAAGDDQSSSHLHQFRGMEMEDASLSSTLDGALPPRMDAIDWSFLDMLDSNYGGGTSSDAIQDLSLYSGFDNLHSGFDNMPCDMYMPQLVSPKHYNNDDDDDDGQGDENAGGHFSSSSFLWNF